MEPATAKREQPDAPEKEPEVKRPAAAESGVEEFHSKCASGDLEGVAAALKADPALASALDSNLWCGVHHATKHGHTGTLEALLSAGADVDARTHHESTALHIAACQNRAAAAKTLLAHKCDCEARDNKKNTALLRASRAPRTSTLAPRHLPVATLPAAEPRVVRRRPSTATPRCSRCCWTPSSMSDPRPCSPTLAAWDAGLRAPGPLPSTLERAPQPLRPSGASDSVAPVKLVNGRSVWRLSGRREHHVQERRRAARHRPRARGSSPGCRGLAH